MGKKFFNFRTFFITALFAGLSVFFALLSFSSAPYIGILLFAVTVLLAISGIVFYAFNGQRAKAAAFAAALFSGVFAFSAFVFTVKTWHPDVGLEGAVPVEARVDSVDFDAEGSDYMLSGLTVGGKKASGRLKLYTEGKNAYAVGDRVRFTAPLHKVELCADGIKFDGTSYRLNLRYRAYVATADITRVKGSPTVLQKIKIKLSDTLITAMGQRQGGIAFAMLTGDKDGLLDGVADYFGAAGLRHLMAVSGLHVGFVALLLFKFLRIFKANASVRLCLLAVVLFLYALLAGFSPSVMRAAVMSLTACAATAFGKRNDRLNAFCLAFTLIVTFCPGFLFEAGFVLSFCCVGVLVLFGRSVSRFLHKRLRFPARLADTVSATLCVQAGVIPPTIFFFGQVQVYSLLTNFVVLPCIFFLFAFMLVSLILTLIFSPFSILLRFSGLSFALLDSTASFVARLPGAYVFAYSTAGIFSVFLLYLFASKYFMLKKNKAALSACLMLLSAALCALSVGAGYKPAISSYAAPVNSFKEVTTVLDVGGEAFIVGEVKDFAAVKNALYSLRLNKVKAVYLFSLNDRNAENLISLSYLCDIAAVYCPESKIEGGYKLLSGDNLVDRFVGFTPERPPPGLTYGEQPTPYYLFEGEANILFVPYKGGYSRLGAAVINSADVIRCALYQNVYPDRLYLTNFRPELLGGRPLYQLSLAEQSDFAFDYVNGGYVALA